MAAFPLDILTELYINGAWVKVPTYNRDTVSVEYGQGDMAAQTDPARLSITVNNRDGVFSPRNPMSPYWGHIGRNSRVRLSVPGTESYLDVDGSATGIASTPDTAALDLTGDIDLRWEGETDWYTTQRTFLMGKWSETGNRSYAMYIANGDLYLGFALADGTGLAGDRGLPVLPRRAALRGTLDVDNGSGGFTVRLYWAETIAGPWTQIGADVTSTAYGTITLRTTTAPLQIAPSGPDYDPPIVPVAGRVHRAQVRNGIDGTLVAAPDFTAQTAGTTSFTDSAGRLWSLTGQAAIRDRHDLFVGEVSEWPQQWQPDSSDAWVPLEASGILRRMGQGKKALDSALRRRIPTYAPLAYWPMEEGALADQAYSPVDGVAPLSLTQAEWAAADTLPSSGPLPELRSQSGTLAMMSGSVPAPSSTPTGWSVNYVYRLDTPPTTLYTVMRVLATGTVREWYLQSRDSQSRVIGRDDDGNNVVDALINTDGDLWNQWIMVRFYCVQQSATTVAWRIEWQDVGGDAGGYGETYTGTVGRPTGVASPPDGYAAALDGMALGHISVWPSQTTAAYNRAFDAWAGDTAWNRMRRLCQEEEVPLAAIPSALPTEQVGPQTADTLLTLLQAAADADGGLLLEDRRWPGLLYRERASMYSQEPKLTLSYDQAPGLAAPLAPVDDDTAIRNDRTVVRAGGSEGRAVLEDGPLSVQEPPDGVGRYDDSVTLSLYSDAQTEPIAYWRLHLGTVDEPRYPDLTVLLHKAPELIPAVLGLDEGDLVRITDLPPFVGSGHVDLLMRGIRHAMTLDSWTATLNCVPASPWQVGVVGDDTLGRVDTDGTVLAVDADTVIDQIVPHTPGTTTAPAVPWITSAGPAPTYASEFPFDITFGGETAQVTACTPVVWDTFSRTVASGWGTSDAGWGWASSGGTAAERSVGSGYGAITLASDPATARFQRVVTGFADCEVLVRMSVSAVATGAAFLPAVLLRYTDVSNFYRARLHFNVGGTMAVSITRAYTTVGTAPTLPYTYTAGAWFWVRARLTGHRVQMRVWPDGQREPAVWHADETITTDTIATGQYGLAASTFGGNTNVSPQLRFDDFQMPTPQIMTVTRSLNGITKTHAAGTDVRLAQPAHVAL